jgi:hypothetical protein
MEAEWPKVTPTILPLGQSAALLGLMTGRVSLQTTLGTTLGLSSISDPQPAGLDKMYLWNVQEGNALDRGTSAFDIYYSNSPTLAAPAAGGTVTSYDFGSGGWTQLSAGNNLAQGTQVGDAGESFDISGASGAQYIGLHLTANHGGFRTGLGEIAITTGAVPEPSSLGLLLLGGILGLRRRR